MLAAISIMVFWTAFFGTLAAPRLIFRPEDPVKRRMKRFFGEAASSAAEPLTIEDHLPSRHRLKETLMFAGLSRKKDMDNIMRITLFCRTVPLMLTVLFFMMGFPLREVIAVGVLLTVAFIVIPRLLIIRATFKRRREITRNLPDALELLTLCLEAGMSFDASLVRVAHEMRNVSSYISREFTVTNQEILAGKPREEALKALAWRCAIEDMAGLVAAIQQSIKLGTSLVNTLRIQADVIRKKRRERTRALIMQTPVKLIFPLLFFIFPILLLIILGPSLVIILRHFTAVGY